MNFYISYFYQVRFFKPNIVPISTCLSDPLWFHKGLSHRWGQFTDKNGVINGIRAEPLVPGPTCEGLCSGPDGCKEKELNHTWCDFLWAYYNQLQKLSFKDIYIRFSNLEEQIKEELKILDKDIDFVLIVYETPSNPCSERRMLQKWFKENGYDLKEWDKNYLTS